MVRRAARTVLYLGILAEDSDIGRPEVREGWGTEGRRMVEHRQAKSLKLNEIRIGMSKPDILLF